MIRTLRVAILLGLLAITGWATLESLAVPAGPARLLAIVSAFSLSIALVACLTAAAAMKRAGLLRSELNRVVASTESALQDLTRASRNAAQLTIPQGPASDAEPASPAISLPSPPRAPRSVDPDFRLRPMLDLADGQAGGFDIVHSIRAPDGAMADSRRAIDQSTLSERSAFELRMISAALKQVQVADARPLETPPAIHVAVSTAFLRSAEHVEQAILTARSVRDRPCNIILSVQHDLLGLESKHHATLVRLHTEGFGLSMEIDDEPVEDLKCNGLVGFVRIPAFRLIARGRPRMGRQSRVAEAEHAAMLGIPVIATGVSSRETEEALRAMGIDLSIEEEDHATAHMPRADAGVPGSEAALKAASLG